MKHPRDLGRAVRRGTTLIELLIVVVLLGGILGSMAFIGRANDRAYRTGATSAHLEDQAASTVERIVHELRIAIIASAVVGPNSIEYSLAEGLDGHEVVWSPTRLLRFEYETGEDDDGLDNNGNGLIDEGQVVLIEDPGPGERRRVLTRWVREGGFLVELEGETLRITLTLERQDADHRLLSRTCTTSTKLRN